MTAALEGGEWSEKRLGPHFTPGKDPVPIVQEAGWAPGPVWTGGKSRPHRDSIPNRPSRSQSLYRLSYRAHIQLYVHVFYGSTYGVEHVFCRCLFVIYEFNRPRVYKSRPASRNVFEGNPVVIPIGDLILKLRFIVTLFNPK